VVGMPNRRSQGCGIAELPVTTRHIFFTGLAVTGCCEREGRTTFLLGSAAKADAQNATASRMLAHRADQPHTRLSLHPIFIL